MHLVMITASIGFLIKLKQLKALANKHVILFSKGGVEVTNQSMGIALC